MNPGQPGRPVVFLDRDGTLNEEVGYIRDLSNLVLIKGAAAAVRRLNESKVAAVLITNQSGAARGYYPEDHIRALNSRLLELLKHEHAWLDAVYYCPHLPEGTVASLACECQCRKPANGLVEEAFTQHPELDRRRAYVVGDKATDVELARNCHARAVLVQTGYGQKVIDGQYQWAVKPDFIAPDLKAGVDWILADLGAEHKLVNTP